MKIAFTKHALRKREILLELGWNLRLEFVENVVKNPDLVGTTNENQPTAMRYLDKRHFLRVVYEKDGDIIRVVTFHISTKGRYAT